MTIDIDIVVIGAGIAGLGAAYQLRRIGGSATIFEARARAGGLLDNIIVEGFYFDTAVHLSFASEPEVRELFDRTEYLTHVPDSCCWDNGQWLKHPAQTNMYPLPAADKTELIAGLAESPTGEISNYRDWLIHQYGRPIAERWPLVYTKKYWTVPAEQLGTDWVGERMRRADLREVLLGAFSEETPNQYYVKEMRYPKVGGYRAFIEPLIDQADITYEHRVVEINPHTKTIVFANGRTIHYDKLISTMPLPRLVEAIPDAPVDIKKASSTLFATEIDLISIGFRRPKVSPALWFYIYDTDIFAARAYSPDWKSPQNVPPGCSALQFEIYSSKKSPQTRSPEELKANTIDGIVKMGLASKDDIIFIHHSHVPYGNVVFDIGMEQRRDKVRNWVETQGVHLAGRFGKWEYLWSHQSLLSGFRAAERALAAALPAS